MVRLALVLCAIPVSTVGPTSSALPPTTLFPIGWFSSAPMGTSESFPPAPFKVVVKYWNNNPPENSTAAVLHYLDQARAQGVSVVLELPRRWVATSACKTGPCFETIATMVHAVCPHQALSGWYMADEPDKPRSWIAPSTLDAVAREVRSAESGAGCASRPISAAFATLQEPGNASAARRYVSSADVYMWDKYPCQDSTAGWHAVAGHPFAGPDFASFPAEMRDVGSLVAPQFRSFWFVMQGSIIESAADHGHYCNTSKCWSAGWRECFPIELRNQIYAGLLNGMRGIMFYRLGITGWDQTGNRVRAALNRSWVSNTLLPVLTEITPHLPAILQGPMLGVDGKPLLRTNVTDNLVSAQLYEQPLKTDSRLLVALRWNDAHSVDVAMTVTFELGPDNAGKLAILLDGKGTAAESLKLGSTGRLVGVLRRPGDVNVYRIVDSSALAN